ncbi:hypothetical protein BS636_14540 [Acinetobacter sp. LoGeW2-3]|uniref:hypothetical protein n=1 Tax=Acinetobacter sp. LoGeW2-3 TaxID=1808001 RepID=UPI000C05AB6C|nr:hypothetical protein [Acinetobacter sp. LoGeW2-3]ATO20812.1 hypothetical protein BS636_14540 [Acinetobacter sp. LoGeW2-3]
MTNTNRPFSDINPPPQNDLVDDNNAIKHEEVVKMDPSIAEGSDPNLNSAESTRPLDPHEKEAEAGDQALATGAGSVGGAALGATLGMVGGPGGSLVGGIVGGVLGGIAGKDISTPDHPEHGIENTGLFADHDHYWREQYQSRPYYSESRNVHGDLDYDRDYRGAYQLGYENREHYNGKAFDEAEPDLRSKWEQFKGESRLTWEQAKYAVKDAWDRTTR